MNTVTHRFVDMHSELELISKITVMCFFFDIPYFWVVCFQFLLLYLILIQNQCIIHYTSTHVA